MSTTVVQHLLCPYCYSELLMCRPTLIATQGLGIDGIL